VAFKNLLDRQCLIVRLAPALDQYKTPRAPIRETLGPYPCALSRKLMQAAQEAPQNKATEVYTLYLPKWADVRAGDLAEVSGAGKYRLGPPYRPRNHHTEAQADWEGEA
jgi:hypothetical protein